MRARVIAPALAVALVAGGAAGADARPLCRPGAVHRGPTIDLDVTRADLREVFRLIAEVADVNLVIPADVTGSVTLRLRKVPWPQVACTIAAVHALELTVEGSILLVRRRAARPTP